MSIDFKNFFGKHSTGSKVLILVVLTVVMRFPTLIYPKAINDERVYSVVAMEMLEGGYMYLDAIERKPPLLFWTYELIFKIGGAYNYSFLHFVSLIWILFSMLGLYLLTRHLFDRDAGIIAALFYAVFVSWAAWSNLALNGEILMNLPLIWGIWLVMRVSAPHRKFELILAGFLLSCSFLLKQPAAIMAVPLGLFLLSKGYREKAKITMFTSFLHAGLLTFAFFVTLLLVALELKSQGILEEAIHWTVSDHDVPHGVTDPVFWKFGFWMTLAFVGACWIIVYGSYINIRNFRNKNLNLWDNREAEFRAMILLLIASVIGASQPGRFYAHYYIQIVPILCVLAAPVFSAIWTNKYSPSNWLLKPLVTKIWLAVTIIGFMTSHTIEIAMDWKIGETGNYLRLHSNPSDKIFVWGQATPIYLDAQRRPASRYIATFPLTGYIFGSPLGWDPSYDTSDRILPGAWENLREDFIESPPEFIVDTDAARATARYPIAQFPYLASIIENCYTLESKMPDGIIYKKKKNDCPEIFSQIEKTFIGHNSDSK